MTRHVDAETLARYRQEDLSRRRASRIRAHLAGCERCRALDEDLAGVTALLADAQPPPIPEHLAARIQTAIAAEAARRVALPVQTASAAPTAAAGDAARPARTEPAGTGVPDRQTSRRGRHGRDRTRQRRPGFASPVVLRTMAAAAAVVVLAGGGYEIAQHVGSSSPNPTAASAPRPRQGNYSAPASGSTALPRPRYLRVGNQDVPVIASGTNYTPATLSSEVRSIVAQYGPLTRARPGAFRSPLAPGNPSQPYESIPAATLAECVTRIAAGQHVLLVDVASYRGTLATVIVTGASAGGPEQVWVVGRGCSGTSSNLIAHATLAPGG